MLDDDARQLRTGMRALNRRLRREGVPPAGLSRTALQVLAAVARRGDKGVITPREIAAALAMESSNVAAALRALDDSRCISRTPDPHDGRRVQISLTDKGAAVIAERRHDLDSWLGRAMAQQLSATELAILLRAAELMRRLAAFEDDEEAAAEATS